MEDFRNALTRGVRVILGGGALNTHRVMVMKMALLERKCWIE